VVLYRSGIITDPQQRGAYPEAELRLLQHYFSGFDHGGNRVADLQFHLINAAACDHAFYLMLADFHHDVSHDVAELQLDYLADQSVTRG
jgi:hypothetical protein